jgi:NitT/TauT family transport system substrate-binding protein
MGLSNHLFEPLVDSKHNVTKMHLCCNQPILYFIARHWRNTLKVLRGIRVAGLLAALVVLLIPSSFLPIGANASSSGSVRIGYFANVTHAPALIARQLGLFEKELGDVSAEYTVFSVGTAAVEALKGGALDIAYIGPNPAISGYMTTNRTLLRIVSGATTGGAKFVVRPELIETPGAPTQTEIRGLAGNLFATPGLGGTQDVAFRSYLKSNGIELGTGRDQVAIAPSDNSTTLSLFQNGEIAGAWVPEPWATRLQLEGKGLIFIDEASLWKSGKFATTNIVVSQKFLAERPALVRQILQANNSAIKFLSEPMNATKAKELVQMELLAQTGKRLSEATIDGAWSSLSYSADPVAGSLRQNFLRGVESGVLRG